MIILLLLLKYINPNITNSSIFFSILHRLIERKRKIVSEWERERERVILNIEISNKRDCFRKKEKKYQKKSLQLQHQTKLSANI